MYNKIIKSASVLLLMILMIVSTGCSNEVKCDELQRERASDITELINVYGKLEIQ